MSNLEISDRQVAESAVTEAGNLIRKALDGMPVEEKGIGDLVTEVDRGADRAVRNIILRHRPDDRILSEELSPTESLDGTGRVWVVDPLDGTAAFVYGAGLHLPAVLVALRVDGVTELGVVDLPLIGQRYAASRGRVASEGYHRWLKSGSSVRLREAWVDINHYGDARLETPIVARLREGLRLPKGARMVTTSMPHSGIAMRVIDPSDRLSAVVHDNNPEKVKQGPWDVAAVQLIVEEAGGVVVGLESGGRYDLTKPEPFVVAESKELAMEILEVARP